MKIAGLDRANATRLHNDLNILLKKFAADNGLTLKPTSAKFGSFDFNKKITLKINSTAAATTDRMNDKLKFQMYSGKYNYDSNLFNQIVNIAGTSYRVDGVNPRSYRKPIKLIRVSDNKSFKCNSSFLKSATK